MISSAEACPISDAEAAALLDTLKSYKHVVLAVSGGADSTCLMHLTARWLELGLPGAMPHVEVVTVDHGLRPESGQEARWVAERATALGFRHTTLAWNGEKPATGIQDAARQARYALLAAHARREAPSAVVTAHTEDDQAETLLMRLGRGSGLDGLAGMAARRKLIADGSVDLVRPLLGVAKTRLVATLEAAGQSWIEDPSNDAPAFERVRLRRVRATLEGLGLTSDKLALSARRLGRARDALESATESFRQTHVAFHDGLYASFAREVFALAPPEVRIRVLASLLEAFGGDGGAARLAKVEALETILAEGGGVVRTLGGCMVSAGQRMIRIFREPSARDLPQIQLAPGFDAIWDRRFAVSLSANAGEWVGQFPAPLVLRALGGPVYATLRGQFSCRLPPRPAASLPGLWSGEDLVGVPDLIWPQDEPRSGAPEGQLIRFTARFVGGALPEARS